VVCCDFFFEFDFVFLGFLFGEFVFEIIVVCDVLFGILFVEVGLFVFGEFDFVFVYVCEYEKWFGEVLVE